MQILNKLNYWLPKYCVNCTELTSSFLCTECQHTWENHLTGAENGNMRLFALDSYRGITRKIILEIKLNYNWKLLHYLAEIIVKNCFFPYLQQDKVLVLLVAPNKKSANRNRGEDLVLEVAERISDILNSKGVKTFFVKPFFTDFFAQDSVGLDHSQRLHNLSKYIRINTRELARLQSLLKQYRNTEIIFIDDVFTSGNTYNVVREICAINNILVENGFVIAK